MDIEYRYDYLGSTVLWQCLICSKNLWQYMRRTETVLKKCKCGNKFKIDIESKYDELKCLRVSGTPSSINLIKGIY